MAETAAVVGTVTVTVDQGAEILSQWRALSSGLKGENHIKHGETNGGRLDIAEQLFLIMG